MSLPTPDDVRKDLEAIVQMLPEVLASYRWAHGWVLSPAVVRDEGRTGGRSRPVHELNPTHDVAMDQIREQRRKAMERAAEKVLDARKQLYGALRTLQIALEAPKKPIEQIAKPPRYGALVSKPQLKEAIAKQAEREASGEAIP